MKQVEIKSITDFLSFRSQESDENAVHWYRGHSDASWKLLPGYFRDRRAASELTLMSRFKQSAAMLTELEPKSDFDWLFVMQHYGVPTRLLDWSESPLVGLYFAVEDADDTTDAALWRLDPSRLNRNANIVDPDEERYVPSFEDDVLEGYSPASVRQNRRLELFPVATIATRNNARIQAQLGTFTIHHNNHIPIEDVGRGEHVTKFVIPSKSCLPILNELKLLGINRFSMFPELASVGRLVKDSM